MDIFLFQQDDIWDSDSSVESSIRHLHLVILLLVYCCIYILVAIQFALKCWAELKWWLSIKCPRVSFLQRMWQFFWLFCAWNYFFKLRFFPFTVISLTLFLLNKLWINLFQENKNTWYSYVKKLCVQSTVLIEAFADWNYDLKTDFAKCWVAEC